jgi:hypothetical protein
MACAVIQREQSTICRLCLADTTLCDSHIIPNFVYRQMNGEKNRVKLKLITAHPVFNERYVQTGIKEPLLCKKCESQLSLHEKYVKESIYSQKGAAVERSGNLMRLSGLNYKHVRLCFLSMLWRMSVSAHEMFKYVDLGPHEERLRQMILDEEVDDPDLYGFSCIVPIFKGVPFYGLVVTPDVTRVDDVRAYRAVIGGPMLMFHVASHKPSAETRELFIKSDGTWLWLRKDMEEMKYFKDVLGKLKIIEEESVAVI